MFLERLIAAQGEITGEREEQIAENIERLFNMRGYTFSALEIDKDTDEELVSNIFVRVNSGGQKLNQEVDVIDRHYIDRNSRIKNEVKNTGVMMYGI